MSRAERAKRASSPRRAPEPGGLPKVTGETAPCLSGRPGACCPHAAPATRRRLPATFKPGQDASPELPPQRSESLLPLPALECLSHPAVPTTQRTPDVPDPQDPPPLCSAAPFSQRLRPTPPPSARRVPRSLCLETHPRDAPRAVRAVLAAPPLSRGPAAAAQAPAPHRPGQQPRPTAHWPARALHWPTSLTAKAAPGSGPQAPTMLRPALSASEASVGQPWTPPQTFPRDTRQNTAPNALCPTCGLWHLPPPWTPSPSRPGRLPVVTVCPPHPEQCPVESTISEYFLSKWRNKPKHFLVM